MITVTELTLKVQPMSALIVHYLTCRKYISRYTGTIKAEGFHLYGKTRKNFSPNGTVQLPSAFPCIGKLFFSVGNKMKRSLKTYSFRLKMLVLSEGICRQ